MTTKISNGVNQFNAELNFFRMAPRKVRLVANLIKGMDVARAELELRHVPKRASLPLLKLLKSAVQNAAHNFQQQKDALYVKDIRVNPGPVLKRMMPRAFGRGAVILKRMSHVSLVLAAKGGEEDVRSQVRAKTEIAVRDMRAEEVTRGSDARRRQEREDKARDGGKRASSGFVKKMFRRKVI